MIKLLADPLFYFFVGPLTVGFFFLLWLSRKLWRDIRAMLEQKAERLAMEVQLPKPDHPRWTLMLSEFRGMRDGIPIQRPALGFKLDEKGEDFPLCVEMATCRVHIGSGPHSKSLDEYGHLVVNAYRQRVLAKVRKVVASENPPPEPTVKAEEPAKIIRRQEIEIMHTWLGAYGKFTEWAVDEDDPTTFSLREVKDDLAAIAEKTRTRLKELGQ